MGLQCQTRHLFNSHTHAHTHLRLSAQRALIKAGPFFIFTWLLPFSAAHTHTHLRMIWVLANEAHLMNLAHSTTYLCRHFYWFKRRIHASAQTTAVRDGGKSQIIFELEIMVGLWGQITTSGSLREHCVMNGNAQRMGWKMRATGRQSDGKGQMTENWAKEENRTIYNIISLTDCGKRKGYKDEPRGKYRLAGMWFSPHRGASHVCPRRVFRYSTSKCEQASFSWDTACENVGVTVRYVALEAFVRINGICIDGVRVLNYAANGDAQRSHSHSTTQHHNHVMKWRCLLVRTFSAAAHHLRLNNVYCLSFNRNVCTSTALLVHT